MKELRGTGVALVTPFHKDLSVDFDGLTRLIEIGRASWRERVC